VVNSDDAVEPAQGDLMVSKCLANYIELPKAELVTAVTRRCDNLEQAGLDQSALSWLSIFCS
jgi:hypothetical protein